MKRFVLIVFVFPTFLLWATISEQVSLTLKGGTWVYTYTEPTIEVSLDYKVIKDTLFTRLKSPDVPYTRLAKLAGQRPDESLPPLLTRSFSCLNHKIAVTPHETGYSFRDFKPLIDLEMEPEKDTIFVYTQRYMLNCVLSKVGYYLDNPDFRYYEFRFYHASDKKLIYILGYVDKIGFVSVKYKVILENNQPELREWSLRQINGIPIETCLKTSYIQKFQFLEDWAQK